MVGTLLIGILIGFFVGVALTCTVVAGHLSAPWPVRRPKR